MRVESRQSLNHPSAFGKLRQADIPILETAVKVFKKHRFSCALHGTSLWNPQYKDIDLLVIPKGDAGNSRTFMISLHELEMTLHGSIQNQRGNPDIGFDLEMILPSTVLHISFVRIL